MLVGAAPRRLAVRPEEEAGQGHRPVAEDREGVERGSSCQGGGRYYDHGKFQTGTAIDIEKEFGWFEPDPDVEAEFNRRHVIVASSVRSKEGIDLVVRTTGQRNAEQRISSIAPLLRNDAEKLVGRMVSVDATVGRVIGDRTFTIGTGEQQVLALVAEPITARGGWDQQVTPGSKVMVSGVVLAVPDELPAPKLTPEERRAVADREVYIYATEVRPKK